MNRFSRLLRPLSASVHALCNIKYRPSLLVFGYKRGKGLSPFQSVYKVSVRQISSANNIGENDRDILDDSFSILGFLAVSVLAFSFTKLIGGENDGDDISKANSKEDLKKRSKNGMFSRTSSGSNFQQMERVRSAKRKLQFLDERNEENSSTTAQTCVTRKKAVSKTILFCIPRSKVQKH